MHANLPHYEKVEAVWHGRALFMAQ